MTPTPNTFSSTAVNWRATLKTNQRKTMFVIGLFFLIYFSIGLLIDVYLYTGQYPNVPISDILTALLTLQLFPIATCVMVAIAAISLFITITFNNRLMLLGTEYREITPTTAQTSQEKQLYNIIEELKIAAGLHYMPRVFIINAPYMNAFASGYSEKSAMVAITEGLLEKLNRSELQAVMAHELSHIRHMDIKLTLIASVLSNLMIMVLDIFFYNLLFSRRSSNDRRQSFVFIIMLLRYLLPVINIILLLYLSRTREYMADAGSVELLRDNQALASALLKINQDHSSHQETYQTFYANTPHENVRREAYIFDPSQAGIHAMHSFADLFSTHPNLKDRLAALGFKYHDKS